MAYIKIFTCFRTILVFLHVIYVSSGYPRAARLFDSPGVLWLENLEGEMCFRHVPITTNTWALSAFPEQPVTVAKGRHGAHNFTHMHVDSDNQTLVTTDPRTKTIIAVTFSEMGLSTFWTLYEGISHRVNGIAVDWTTDVVYWTDAAYDVILGVSMEKPNMAEVIVDTELDEPFSIVVYPQKGYMYWTDADVQRPRLMQATLGGRHIKTMVYLHRRRPLALTIDYSTERLYILCEDATGQQAVTFVETDGRLEQTITETTNAVGIAVYERQLVIMSADSLELFHVERKKKGLRLPVKGTPSSVLVLDSARQPYRSNICQTSRCPGLCTRTNFTDQCFCNAIEKERVNYVIKENFCGADIFNGLLFAKGDGIYTVKTNFMEYKSRELWRQLAPKRLVHSYHKIKALASNVRQMRIYFYESGAKILKSVRTESASVPETISLAVGEIAAIAVDAYTGNVYWTDAAYGHIMVASEDGAFQHMLHSDLNRPWALAVHPKRRYRMLFWSELNSAAVYRSYLDGSEKSAISSPGYHILGIAVDYKFNVLYLCDSVRVYTSELDGSNFTTVYARRPRAFTGIALFHDYVVVTDSHFQSGGVHVFDRGQDGRQFQFMGSRYSGYRYGYWYDVTYHHVSAQPNRRSVCEMSKDRCDQLCLSAPVKPTCACSLGYVRDGTHCNISQPYVPFLMLVDQRNGALFQINAVQMTYVRIPVQGVQQPFALTYDPVEQMVYWSDLEGSTISRSRLDGSQQEIIVHDPDTYVTDLELDPGSRGLYYVTRARDNVHRFTIGGLHVYHVDTGRGLTILDKSLHDPRGLGLDSENGHVYFTEQGDIWRMDSNGSDPRCIVRGVTSHGVTKAGEYVYFLNLTEAEYPYNEAVTEVLQSDVDGENVTVLMTLTGLVTSFTVDSHFIYWTNSTNRGIQRARISSPGTIIDVGPARQLFQPADIFANNVARMYDNPCSRLSCQGICLRTPSGPICEERVTMDTLGHALDTDAGHCRIPTIENGDVVGNSHGHVVPNGFTSHVECYPAHHMMTNDVITCRDGEWSRIPKCILDYTFCGTKQTGYKVYRDTGTYFVYPETTKVEVLLIGGGGGGYDVTNHRVMNVTGKAGDGGNSSFGGYLHAYGGKGGSATHGGRGGFGHANGGDGSDYTGSCGVGGTAGQAQPGPRSISLEPFTGSGAYSYECTASDVTRERLAGPGGVESTMSFAGMFGGGAGGRHGGSGGGGGFSRLMVPLEEKQLVPVVVGQAGFPSYGEAAPGVVIVAWGNFQVEDYVNDVINSCSPFI
ncbi:low-density lipoprotein receptor-related protein 1-like [Mya arenaria]|uniref:low-density lipoprotein receptor-related protein 1-like n=1 Tax=Mya arenaria TaxID=6604 RepID=UPI0022E5D5E6|nr:low-density lipoprotein receptor-related protein 1-like [Mya arenaria]